MKAKVNIPKRGNSNPPLKNLPPSALLEEQTKKMEQRLKDLKDVMADQAAKRESLGSGSGSRWQSANQNMPIKNYAETVLKSKPKDIPTPKGTTVVKPSRDRPSREKVPPLAGPTVTTPSGTVNLSQKNKENESQKDFFKTTAPSTSTSVAGSATKTVAKPQRTQVEDEKTAENNINRALSKQKETTGNEVDKFLEEIGLTQYADRFRENGFDDMETLMDAQTKHFVDMKIPAGHQIKLSKRIEQLKQSTKPAEKIILPNQKVDTKPTNQINMNQVKASKTEYVQLDEPTKEQGIGDDRIEGGELLKGGAYNEAESHKSFQEALNEWRSGKPAAQPPGSAGGSRNKNRPKDSREKKVRFADPADEPKGKDDSDETDYISSKAPPKKKEAPKVEKQDDKKSFFFSGGNSWNQVEVPAQKETSTNMSPREAQVSQKPKVSCWHCYRLVNDDEIKNCGKKQFCSDECVKNYRDLNSTQCLKKGCSNKFLKEEGIMREGKWYCSEKCAPSMEEILMEEQRLMKKIEKEERGDSRGSQGSSARSGKGKEEDSGEDEKIEIDLSVDVTNKKQVLTLAELEEKYKNLNKLAEKAEEGENEFEDSLN